MANEAVAQGGDAFFKWVQSDLSQMLARFIVDNKVLDGPGAFTMTPRPDLDATDCVARIHVLTPDELEDALTKAFDAGSKAARDEAKAERTPAPKVTVTMPWQQPHTWEGDPYSLPNLPMPDEAAFQKMIRKIEDAERLKRKKEFGF